MKYERKTEYGVFCGRGFGLGFLYDERWSRGEVGRLAKRLMERPDSPHVTLTIVSRPRGGEWSPILRIERAAA